MWGSVGAGVRAWVGRAPRDRACARRKVLGRKSFRAVREGVGLIAFNARFGTVSLLLVCVGVRGIGPAVAEEA